jgi:hypothetical protein
MELFSRDLPDDLIANDRSGGKPLGHVMELFLGTFVDRLGLPGIYRRFSECARPD